jgi:hypothetical protein
MAHGEHLQAAMHYVRDPKNRRGVEFDYLKACVAEIKWLRKQLMLESEKESPVNGDCAMRVEKVGAPCPH